MTAVCSSRNVDLVAGIGADNVIDYTESDYVARGQRYDLILDAVGRKPLRNFLQLLEPGGAYVGITGSDGVLLGPLTRWLQLSLANRATRRQLLFLFAKPDLADLELLTTLLESGAIRPVIDAMYSLHDGPAALAHVATTHTRGKVVITM